VTLPLVVQLVELYKTGVRGVLKGQLLATFLVKNCFYTAFAYTLPGREPVLMYAAPVWVVLSMWLMWKWYVSPQGEVAPQHS
jgi:ABC-type branched-subunit amino acid transport system permease subunit